MTHIVAIAGSLRKASFNRALLSAAMRLAAPATTIEIVSFAGFPIYDGDLEQAGGVPAVVEQVKDGIAAADGLLLATPEYNNSIPGPLKNAIDWLTRPPKDIARVFGSLPVGLLGATPGRGGTRLGQLAWLPVFRTLGMRPWFERSLFVAEAGRVFDASLELADEKVEALLADFVTGFAAYCREQNVRGR
jgi:chromate reductase, NAD(P)H dehydrogenase (quinone)